MTSILTDSERSELCELLFPDSASLPSLSQLEDRFPARNHGPNAMIMRVAPSPTGFAHIGAIYTALLNRTFAQQSGGVFILRVEDTDSKREVAGAFETLINSLALFGQDPDEGYVRNSTGEIEQRGTYGPYLQSQRKEIYRACAIHLLKSGSAYPCFCTEEELSEMNTQQTAQKARTGYYGYWAKWRDRSLTDIKAELGKRPFVIRLRSAGDPHQRVQWEDGVKGRIAMPQNDLDSVILKSDGQSLYHLAHAMDDHFMRITHVLRGDEWISSVPLHIQIFQAFGWQHPNYAHLSTIQKLDTITEIDPETGKEVSRQSKRKLSKRKDPEANVDFYVEAGFPTASVIEYLTNIANSDFEDWRKANPDTQISEFKLKLNRLSPSAALADPLKLASISRDVIGRMPIDELFAQGLAWCKRFDRELVAFLEADPNYAKSALNIEREGKKPSRRITTWRDLRPQLSWFYESMFDLVTEFDYPENVTHAIRTQILERFLATYDPSDSREQWFDKCKVIATEIGFAPDLKQYKANPGAFPGHVGDVTNVLRVAMCSTRQSPELCEVMRVLGTNRVTARCKRGMI